MFHVTFSLEFQTLVCFKTPQRYNVAYSWTESAVSEVCLYCCVLQIDNIQMQPDFLNTFSYFLNAPKTLTLLQTSKTVSNI